MIGFELLIALEIGALFFVYFRLFRGDNYAT